MAANTNKDSQKLEEIFSVVMDVKKNQEGMRKMFESKLDKLKNDLMENIDHKIKSLRDELVLDLGVETKRVYLILSEIQELKIRVDKVEQSQGEPDQSGANNGTVTQQHTNEGQRYEADPESIMASGVVANEGENLVQKALDIIKELGGNIYTEVTIKTLSDCQNVTTIDLVCSKLLS